MGGGQILELVDQQDGRDPSCRSLGLSGVGEQQLQRSQDLLVEVELAPRPPELGPVGGEHIGESGDVARRTPLRSRRDHAGRGGTRRERIDPRFERVGELPAPAGRGTTRIEQPALRRARRSSSTDRRCPPRANAPGPRWRWARAKLFSVRMSRAGDVGEPLAHLQPGPPCCRRRATHRRRVDAPVGDEVSPFAP